MEKDLKRLLVGSPAEQDLLGLVTAAGGGLTAADLAELTGLLRWQIQDCLGTVTGRSFSFRDPYYTPDGPAAYLLGHEELQITAIDLLGPASLSPAIGTASAPGQWLLLPRVAGRDPEVPAPRLPPHARADDDLPKLLACVTDHPSPRTDCSPSPVPTPWRWRRIRTPTDVRGCEVQPDWFALTKLAIHRDASTSACHVPVGTGAAAARLRPCEWIRCARQHFRQVVVGGEHAEVAAEQVLRGLGRPPSGAVAIGPGADAVPIAGEASRAEQVDSGDLEFLVAKEVGGGAVGGVVGVTEGKAAASDGAGGSPGLPAQQAGEFGQVGGSEATSGGG